MVPESSTPSPDVLSRFWAKVDTSAGPDGCWPWNGFVNESESGSGYGQFWDGVRLVRAHRFAYALSHGDIPSGLVADHTCHNDSDCTDVPCAHRRCVNPAHLEATTQSINSLRGRSGAHQRAKTHCPSGHPYSEENTIIRDGGRQRVCRTCNRAAQAKYRAKRKAA